jgi:hypothetical protein
MKTKIVGIALAALLSAGAAAIAQTAAFTLAPADQTKFTAWVTEEKKADVPAPAGFTVQVGAVVPESVTLYEIPATVGVSTVTKYRYVKIGGKVVLVDPADRKIVYVVS